jgi:hypothetical protein
MSHGFSLDSFDLIYSLKLRLGSRELVNMMQDVDSFVDAEGFAVSKFSMHYLIEI